MYRIILFLVLIALAAAGAAWVADQPGEVVLSWGGWRVATIAAGIRAGARHRHCRGDAGVDDAARAVAHCRNGSGAAAANGVTRAAGTPSRKGCSRSATAIPLPPAPMPMSRAAMPRTIRWRCCCTRNRRSSTATATARSARSAPWPNARTRGCWACADCSSKRSAPTIRSPRSMIAEEALKLAPSSTWASQAVLGFRCAKGDWNGALAILDNNLASGLIDKPTYRRQRGVLLTARALELEKVDRDLSRDSVMEAVKLAPTLVPAAVLASKYQSEAHQVRRSMRIVEAAWLAQPHPDLADAYAHVKLGDSARQRLVRVETLAAKAPGHLESALAVARAAIDATEFARAREALAPFIAAPTQRVAMLMAEIERTEHGDSGRARAWTLRAVRALHDPVWTADGYVQRSLAAGVAGVGPARRLPVADAAGGVAVGQGRRDRSLAVRGGDAGAAAPRRAARAANASRSRAGRDADRAAGRDRAVPAAQDNSPAPAVVAEPAPAAAARATAAAESVAVAAAPLFRARAGYPEDAAKRASGIPRGDSDRAGARRSRNRRRAGGRRIRGTNQSRAEPGRRLARLSVPLGRLIQAAREPSVFLAKSGAARYQVRAFSGRCRTRRMVRRNSSVGRARHS